MQRLSPRGLCLQQIKTEIRVVEARSTKAIWLTVSFISSPWSWTTNLDLYTVVRDVLQIEGKTAALSELRNVFPAPALTDGT